MKRGYYSKRDNAITEQNVKCKCGHSVFLPAYSPVKICSYCNQLVFKNERVKFRFMLSKRVAVERG